MLSEIPDKCEGLKTPFLVVAKVTTYNESGHRLEVEERIIRADTLKELESRMDDAEAEMDMKKVKSGKKITIEFGREFQLNTETGKYDPLRQAEKTRGLFARLLRGMSSGEK